MNPFRGVYLVEEEPGPALGPGTVGRSGGVDEKPCVVRALLGILFRGRVCVNKQTTRAVAPIVEREDRGGLLKKIAGVRGLMKKKWPFAPCSFGTPGARL